MSASVDAELLAGQVETVSAWVKRTRSGGSGSRSQPPCDSRFEVCALVSRDDGIGDEPWGRRARALLGRARKLDVTDAAVIVIASDGDRVIAKDEAIIMAPRPWQRGRRGHRNLTRRRAVIRLARWAPIEIRVIVRNDR